MAFYKIHIKKQSSQKDVYYHYDITVCDSDIISAINQALNLPEYKGAEVTKAEKDW
jgi:hypothetical protein